MYKAMTRMANYLIWWITAVIGMIVLLIIFVLYGVCLIIFILGELLWAFLVLPCEHYSYSVLDIDNRELPVWFQKLIKFIWKYTGIRPI